MDADKRDERVEELLNKALERGPEERQAFLAQEGADDDTQLLIEVESLIRHHEANTVAKLDQPDWEGAGATLGGQPPGQRTVVGGKDAGARAESTTQLAAAFADHPRYRLLEPLGEGATGAVFKAEHRKMERTVALKVLKVQLVQGTDAIERFHREVKAAAKLNHPNIVTAFDADQQGDIHFLAMEYVRGLTLSKLLAKKGRLPVVHVCEFIRQAALGLQHAHENGMVHRDIKPGNLMITPQGQVKILDFGLARLAQDNQAPRRLTRFGTIMGTPDYISPEQINDMRTVDIRSDIYSLGCTLYYLLAGHPPFPEGDFEEKTHAHAASRPRPITEIRRDVPVALALVVEKMMAKTPAERYQTPAEVAKALQRFANLRPAPVARPAVPPPSDRALARGSPGARSFFLRPTLLAGGVALALLVVTLGTVLVRGQAERGVVVVETDDPDIEVVVKQAGRFISHINKKNGFQANLRAGDYEVELGPDAKGVKLNRERFTLTRDGAALKVEREALKPTKLPP